MSVADSRADHEAASARLADATDEVLERDLTHWTLASYDSAAEYRDLAERQMKLRELHAEEEAWIGLIAAELRKRRTRARAEAS